MTIRGNAPEKKVTISLTEKEEKMMRAVLRNQGFSRPTEFFRYILHKYHDDILELETQVKIPSE